MKFIDMKLPGAYVIELMPIEDERGFFSRSFCQHEFESQGLIAPIAQCNIAYNRCRGVLRGMHYQVPPHEETKLIRCTRGRIFDVVIDLRPTSRTFRQWCGVELSPENRKMVYVPQQFAHGYLTLEDNTEVFYQVSGFYHPESEGGVRWNDPAFGITWPLEPCIISNKDQQHPLSSL